MLRKEAAEQRTRLQRESDSLQQQIYALVEEEKQIGSQIRLIEERAAEKVNRLLNGIAIVKHKAGVLEAEVAQTGKVLEVGRGKEIERLQ